MSIYGLARYERDVERAEMQFDAAYDWACDNASHLVEAGDDDAILSAWETAMAEDDDDRAVDYAEDAWLDQYMEDRLGGGSYDDFDY